jgi:glyoxylase-like metal-dependent hydrolase (beta-lactamase superfamily II)
MSKTLGVRLSAAAVALLCAWVAFTQNKQPPAPIAIEKVKDNLYVVTGPGGNVGVEVTDEGVILIDDKYEQNVAEILEKVKTVTDKPVKYVLSTHHHGDHTGGNPKLIATTEIIAHKNARINMINGKQPAPPRVTFTQETEVFLGGKQAIIRHFGRGHTNGDAAVYFPDLKVVHCGDLFVTGSPIVDYANGASLKEWPATLDGILQWDFDIAIPGHGSVSTRADLMKFRAKMASIGTRVSGLVRQGKSKDEVAKTLLDEFKWDMTTPFGQRALDPMMAEMKN